MDFILDRDEDTPTPTGYPPIDFREALNEEQYAAVTAPPGPLLVLAGAGSGKTRTLTYRVAWLLHQGVPPGEIMLLTFTNKAAREMLHRVHDLTGEDARRFWGGTFHSLGHRALRMFGDAIGMTRNFTIIDAAESETLLKRSVETPVPGFFNDKTNPRPKPLFSVLSMARNTRKTLAQTVEDHYPHYEDIAATLPTFAKAYAAAKSDQNVVDYDDLLELWLKLLNENDKIADYFAGRFRYLLVDEYQDTNTVQSQIIDKLATHHCIMAVGDDAQCIYSWRGADFANIMTFPDRHPDTAIHRIETNYRSTPQILDFANGVLLAQPAGQHYDKELRPDRAHSIKPYVVQAIDDREQAQFLVKRIRWLVEEAGVSPSQIAVLYRSHFVALETQLTFSRAGIPYHITSGVKFFERQHVRDLVAMLRFVYNPTDTSAWHRFACLLPKIGEKGAQKIYDAALQHARLKQIDFVDAINTEVVKAKVPKGAREDWPSFCASLQQTARDLRNATPQITVKTAMGGWYDDYLKGAYADYLDRMDELTALSGFAERFTEMQDLLAQIVLLNGETNDRGIEDQVEAIRLTTVHQAKGLEYNVVFVIGCADGLFPGRRSIEDDNIEEERRLFYVAVTRARNELYICYPNVAMKAGPRGMILHPSRFLQELSTDLYENLHLKREEERWAS